MSDGVISIEEVIAYPLDTFFGHPDHWVTAKDDTVRFVRNFEELSNNP